MSACLISKSQIGRNTSEQLISTVVLIGFQMYVELSS